jgi:hypothetical protein
MIGFSLFIRICQPKNESHRKRRTRRHHSNGKFVQETAKRIADTSRGFFIEMLPTSCIDLQSFDSIGLQFAANDCHKQEHVKYSGTILSHRECID